MVVYELTECEEYAFQISHGLYATKDRAIADAREKCKRAGIYDDNHPSNNVSTVEAYGDTLVIKGLWTQQEFEEWLKKEDSAYWWYRSPFDHHGVFGIFAREVVE